MVGEPTDIELKLGVAPEDIATFRNHPHFASVLHNPTRETLVPSILIPIISFCAITD
jgi:hypothetical protein